MCGQYSQSTSPTVNRWPSRRKKKESDLGTKGNPPFALPKVRASLNLCKARFLYSYILDSNKVRQRKDYCGCDFFLYHTERNCLDFKNNLLR